MTIHLSTYLARSPARLLARIKTLKNNYEGNDLTLLFALSSNFSETNDLGLATSELMGFKNTRTVGCLSGRLGNTQLNEDNIQKDVLSLSVAFLDSGSIIPFRSTIPGREEPQVGRWHAFRRKNEVKNEGYSLSEGVSWEEVWAGSRDIELPQELQSLRPAEIQSILYFSDLKPEGLLSSFRGLPNVSKLGLLASSTPFITGRPVTLFHNEGILDSGAVGLALTGTAKPALGIDFLDIQRLGKPMTVTQCEGNMVNSLNEDNPTQLLISAVKKFKCPDTHVLGWLKDEEQFSLGTLTSDGKIDRVYRITAGDPSRGNISLDSPSAPPTGTRVQFLHRSSTVTPRLSIPRDSQSFNFLTVLDEVDLLSEQESPQNFELLLENAFLASSENGFIFERAAHSGENVKCSLAGSLGSLSWTSFINSS